MAGGQAISRMEQKAKRTANRWRVPLTDGRLGGGDLARTTVREMGCDHLTSFAKAIAFSALLALFPLLLLVVLLLGIFEADQLLTRLVENSRAAIPAEAYDLLMQQVIPSITAGNQTGLTFGAAVTVAVAIWGVSGAMRTLMEAMNVIYEVEEQRGFVSRYVGSFLFALGAAALLVAAAVLVVAGAALARWVGSATGLGTPLEVAWLILQWPLLAGLVLLAFALIYYYAPNVDQSFRFISPGSVIGFVLWLVFTGLFSLYVNNFGSYNQTYGALAGVIVLMLYLFYSSLILLLGGEINQIVEDASLAGKNEGERAPAGKAPA